ncbi:M28 family peptidase, partial [Candidatus Neomarinimicrobiota bacterium]
LVIFDTTLAEAPATWEALRRGTFATRTYLADTVPENEPDSPMEGYLQVDAARAVLAAAGLDYDSLVIAAAQPGFRPLALPLTARGRVATSFRAFTSWNVLGWLPGTVRPDEFVLYMAHWDHVGRDTTLVGDQIFNGAMDNATGTASILELARRFVREKPPPERSILFLGLTAEESGLLGSRFYTREPVFPLNRTVAAINIDMLVSYGKTRDVYMIGAGKSDLDAYVENAAAALGMVALPDERTAQRLFYRSDHINFARAGVPALFLDPGMDYIREGRDWGEERVEQFMDETYHKVSDEYNENWNFDGIIDYLEIVYQTGLKLASEDTFPNWNERDEFRPVRDESLRNGNASPADE